MSLNSAIKGQIMPRTYGEMIEKMDNMPDIRIELLKQGHNAIYVCEEVANQTIMLQPNGKCYFIRSNDELRQNEIIRELTNEEYARLDLIKGRDF